MLPTNSQFFAPKRPGFDLSRDQVIVNLDPGSMAATLALLHPRLGFSKQRLAWAAQTADLRCGSPSHATGCSA